MSASKGTRDWMEYPSFVAAALEHKRGNLTLQDLLDMAESIVRRELAEKAEAVDMLLMEAEDIAKGDVGDLITRARASLSLLTDTPENDK